MGNEIILSANGDIEIASTIPAQWAVERDDAVDEAKAIVTCEDDYSARKVGAALKRVKSLKKIVHDARLEVTRKIDAFKKSVMKREDEICADLTAQENRLSKLGTEYSTAKAAAEEAERKRREEEAKAESMLTGAVAFVEDERRHALIGGVRTRTVVSFEIECADAVPRAYCAPDEKLIREYIQSVKSSNPNFEISDFKIDGVRFFKEVRV